MITFNILIIIVCVSVYVCVRVNNYHCSSVCLFYTYYRSQRNYNYWKSLGFGFTAVSILILVNFGRRGGYAKFSYKIDGITTHAYVTVSRVLRGGVVGKVGTPPPLPLE